jgi:hypothetical protein
MDQSAAQPNSAREDPIDFETAIPLQTHLDDRVPSDEVGMTGIANDEVVNFLGPQPHSIEMVTRGNAAPLEFAFEIVSGDWAALDPHERNHDDKEEQQAKRNETGDAPERTPPHDDGVRRNVEPLVSPLLVHGIH